jgi:hypothetical protein
MAKQSFVTGQVLTAAQLTSLQQTAMSGGAASAKTANYVLVAADAGTAISMTSTSATTITVNTGLFAAGDTVFIQNLGSATCTITAGTATVNTAGSLILPQYDAGILYFVSSSSAVFYDYIQVGATSPLTTKGDLYGFGSSDARIPIGTNGHILTADSTETLGLKWSAPAGGGGMTLLSTTTLSGSTTTISSISQDYNDLYVVAFGITNNTGNGNLTLQISTPSPTPSSFSSGWNFQGSGSLNASETNNTGYSMVPAVNWNRNQPENTIVLHIPNYKQTASMRIANCSGSYRNSGNAATNFYHQYGQEVSTAVSGVSFSNSGGTFSAGTVLVYGVK